MSNMSQLSRRQWLRRYLTGSAMLACSECFSHWPWSKATGRRTCVACEPGESRTRGDVPWLREVQRPPAVLPDDAPRLTPLLLDAQRMPIQERSAWQQRRRELRQQWLTFLGAYDITRMPVQTHVIQEDRPEGCLRQLVQYESEPGVQVEAYLLRPYDASSARCRGSSAPSQVQLPGVVALHSTVDYTIRQPAGLEGDPNLFIGLRLAQQGFVVCCPRCFLWQDQAGYHEQVARAQARHPGSTGMAKMLWDAMRAVDLLESLPEVDAQRLGAIGHSLGAKETLYLAAFDERIRAAVFSEGGIGMAFSNWDAPWYLGQAVARGDWPHDHHELLALVAPRAMLLIGGDSADGDRSWPYVEAALPVYALYGGPARIGLLNHGKGHALPPEAAAKAYDWLETYCA